MAIEFINGKLGEFASGTSREVEKPTGSAGDILVAYAYVEKPLKTIVLSGWTEVTQLAITSVYKLGVFWIAYASAPSKPKLEWGGETANNAFAMETWRGVDAATPIDVKGTMGTGASAKTFEVPSITTVTAKAVQIILAANASGALFNVAPAGFTKRTNYSPGTLSQERVSAGATGATTVEWTSTQANTGYLNFALRPTAVAGSSPELAMVI